MKTHNAEIDQLIKELMEAANFVSSDEYDIVIKAGLAKKAAEKLFELYNDVDMYEAENYQRQMMVV